MIQLTKANPMYANGFVLRHPTRVVFDHFKFILLDTDNAKKTFDLIDVTDSTRKEYKARIGRFLSFCSTIDVNYDLFLEYKRSLSLDESIKVSTKNKYLASAKIFMRELARKGVIPDITHNVKAFRQEKKHKKIGFTELEVSQIKNYLKSQPPTIYNLRLNVFFVLLAFQGLRQIEVVRLDLEDLDLNNNRIFIRGKGRDDKEPINIHHETKRLLLEYLDVVNIKSGPLFNSLGNRKSQRIKTRTIQRSFSSVFSELVKNTKITSENFSKNPEKDFTCFLKISKKTVHGFRHFFTTFLLNNGLDVRVVQKFTRHRCVEMVNIYDDEVKMDHKCQEVFSFFDGIGKS